MTLKKKIKKMMKDFETWLVEEGETTESKINDDDDLHDLIMRQSRMGVK